MSLSAKKILIGVSGGIASYKICDLVRRLKDHKADVHIVMTEAACQFLTPLTLQALSMNPVRTELFNLEQESQIGHIALADSPDLIVIAPATADFIAKAAHGFCNDLLSTILCATTRPVLFCPSMNVNMWNNPATQANLDLLRKRRFEILEPRSGSLACGYEGAGRLPETEEIVSRIESYFASKKLLGLKVLITAGPTWEKIDAVRLITSPASGKTGFLLAEEAVRRGAEVTLVSGPTPLQSPAGVKVIRIQSAQEMAQEVFAISTQMDVIIASAAVSDFRPEQSLPHKSKKETASLKLQLTRNEDILARLGREKKKNQILIGFAAETDHLKEEAIRKLREKNLDFICANDVSNPTQGFGSEENAITLFFKHQGPKALSLLSKREIARKILGELEVILSGASNLKHT